MADETPHAPRTVPNPLASRLERAIKAHPVLRDQKKLVIAVHRGVVRLEGTVFTRDMLRQVNELVDRIPGGDAVRVSVSAEIEAQQARDITGRVPTVSPGPSNVDRSYSTGHLERRRRR